MAKNSVVELSAVLEELKAQVAALVARIEKLEAVAPAVPTPVLEAPPAVEAPVNGKPAPVLPSEVAPEAGEGIPEDILIVISAAVAAFLGERAHIRQVRLIRTGAWAQEGRVSIQASHRLH